MVENKQMREKPDMSGDLVELARRFKSACQGVDLTRDAMKRLPMNGAGGA
jgi:hypothetical protein